MMNLLQNTGLSLHKTEKSDITVAQLMRHEAGLDCLASPIAKELFSNNSGSEMSKLIEDTTPEWSNESKRCYHSMTRGFMLNELVKKITKRNIGQLLDEWIAKPLNAEVEMV